MSNNFHFTELGGWYTEDDGLDDLQLANGTSIDTAAQRNGWTIFDHEGPDDTEFNPNDFLDFTSYATPASLDASAPVNQLPTDPSPSLDTLDGNRPHLPHDSSFDDLFSLAATRSFDGVSKTNSASFGGLSNINSSIRPCNFSHSDSSAQYGDLFNPNFSASDSGALSSFFTSANQPNTVNSSQFGSLSTQHISSSSFDFDDLNGAQPGYISGAGSFARTFPSGNQINFNESLPGPSSRDAYNLDDGTHFHIGLSGDLPADSTSRNVSYFATDRYSHQPSRNVDQPSPAPIAEPDEGTGDSDAGQNDTPESSNNDTRSVAQSEASTVVDYVPLIILPPPIPAQNPKRCLYGPYQSKFKTGEEAKAHRKRVRIEPKKDPRVAYVKKHGREFWVHRIYEAMVNSSDLEDGEKSTHYNRFVNKLAFDADDVEATAHHIFDKACAVHEKGWTQSLVYHKEAVRGSLVDASKNSVEMRLQRICELLYKNKSLCNDALQGGLTLAQLVDNPYLRAGSKGQNNKGNLVRGKRLQAGRQALEGSASVSVDTPNSVGGNASASVETPDNVGSDALPLVETPDSVGGDDSE